MTDEFTKYLMAKRNPQAAAQADYEARRASNPLLAAAAVLVETRAAELRPQGNAIVELLVAIAEHAGQLQAPHEREQTQFGMLMVASRTLHVEDRVIACCFARLHGADPAEIESSFSFNDMLGGK